MVLNKCEYKQTTLSLKSWRIFFLLLFSLFILFLCVSFINSTFRRNELSITFLGLNTIRNDIKLFKEKEGHPPGSLTELGKYARENPTVGISGEKFKEYLSKENGSSEAKEILDGNGGWYYDKKTGEIRVNLVKPVKKYLIFYFGSHRNEIPSEW